ncbi:MAG: hypothetical protein KC766_09400 [Myxococcales bacterium]|nr:hypothetical protein [Myxococcales bacterium]
MRQLSFLGPFLLLAFPSACGSSASDDSLGNGGSAGSAGSAGAGAAAGAGATAGAGGTAGGETTYEALNVCGQAPSYPATASFDDGSGELSIDGLEYVLRRLGSRTPGKFSLTRTTEDGGGSGYHHDVLIVTDDGSVLHASKHRVHAYTSDPPTDIDETTPIQRCTLKPEAYFQSCVSAILTDPQGNEAAECVQIYADWETLPLPYFQSCEPASYSCTPSDMQRLLACAPPDIYGWMTSNEREADGPPRTRQLLEALRDREPGLYRFDTTKDVTYAWGSQIRVMLSRSSDPEYVLTAADGSRYGESDSTPYSTETQRCKLQPPDYFQACIDALDAGPIGFNQPACAHYENQPIFPWFTSCEPAEPVCE